MSVVSITPKPEFSAFDRFWKASPKRSDKVLTRRLFDALTSPDGLRTKVLNRDSGQYMEVIYPQVDPETLIEAMKKYAKTQISKDTYDLIDGGRWTCTPAVFLNRGRWLDFE